MNKWHQEKGKSSWLTGVCLILSRAGNVLLTDSNAQPHGFSAKVADFGLARNLDICSKVETRTYGTITHMPLELLRDGLMSKVRAPACVCPHNMGICVCAMFPRHGSLRPSALTRPRYSIPNMAGSAARLCMECQDVAC